MTERKYCTRCRCYVDATFGLTPSENIEGMCELCAYETTGISEAEEN